MTREYVSTLSTEELRAMRVDLSKKLNSVNQMSHEWDIVWADYVIVSEEEDDRFYKSSSPAFREFVEKNIDGKDRSEIDPDTWGYYSDWHKALYGYRPH